MCWAGSTTSPRRLSWSRVEHEVRDLIRDVCDEARLQKLIAAMQLPPEAKRPSNLEDFTFVQYKALDLHQIELGRIQAGVRHHVRTR